jgi:hypothetical protein
MFGTNFIQLIHISNLPLHVCFEEVKKADISIVTIITSINISHGILFLFGISTHANQWRPFLECAQFKHGNLK